MKKLNHEVINEKQYLSKKEAAFLLSVDVRTIDKAIESEILPVLRLSAKTYRINKDDLRKLQMN